MGLKSYSLLNHASAAGLPTNFLCLFYWSVQSRKVTSTSCGEIKNKKVNQTSALRSPLPLPSAPAPPPLLVNRAPAASETLGRGRLFPLRLSYLPLLHCRQCRRARRDKSDLSPAFALSVLPSPCIYSLCSEI